MAVSNISSGSRAALDTQADNAVAARASVQISSIAQAPASPQSKEIVRAVPRNEIITLPQLRQAVDRATAAALYGRALDLARRERWEMARRVFRLTTSLYPDLCRAWVSWAQMEKRAGAAMEEDRSVLDFTACRAILKKGLELNPQSSCLIQAWGLMELQKGNTVAAVMLLDRCAQYDSACQPVTRWRLYKEAKKTVSDRRRQRT